MLLRAEACPCVRHHARAAAARGFYGMIAAARIDDERFGAKRRRRRHSAMSAAASRVITTSETGSGSDMRMSNRRGAWSAPRRRSILAIDEEPRFYVVCESLPHVRGQRRATMSATPRPLHPDERRPPQHRRAACWSSALRRSATSSTRSPSCPTSGANARTLPSTGSRSPGSRRWSHCVPMSAAWCRSHCAAGDARRSRRDVARLRAFRARCAGRGTPRCSTCRSRSRAR